MLVLEAYRSPTRILCAREIQKSIEDSVLQLLADTIERMGLSGFFEVQRTTIYAKNGSRFIFEGLRSNVTKIKSMEGIDRVWVEEAEAVTFTSWETLIPTIRKPNSEIWVSFNPADEMDDTYQRFVVNTPPDCKLVEISWPDNPWFPEELRKEKDHLYGVNENLAEHVWGGKPLLNHEGAYWAKYINADQVKEFAIDPSIPVNTYWDLGISDSMAIWMAQTVGTEVRVIQSYENHGEGLQHYINYLHDFRAKHNIVFGQHYAPHDISVRELGTGKSRLETARSMGISFVTVPNLPVVDGIHAARQLIPRCWFRESGTKDGLRALRAYRKEFDEVKGCWKDKPLHNWASHYADAFRYFGVTYRQERVSQNSGRPAVAKVSAKVYR